MSERPLSPHLQVYKWEWTMALSILHRMTGVFLSFAAFFVVFWLYALAADAELFASVHGFLSGMVGQIALIAVLFSTFYHLANGIRHLIWDTGRALELGPAFAGALLVIAFAVVATAISAFFMFGGAA